MWFGGLCGWVVYVIEWLMWLGGLFDGWFVLLNGLCGWVVYLIGWFVLLDGLCGWVVMWFGDLCSQGLALLPYFLCFPESTRKQKSLF